MKHRIILFSFALLLSFIFSCSGGKYPITTGKNFVQKFHKEVKITYDTNYLIYLPDGYESSGKPWPLVMFLHGSGERGTEINAVKSNGPPMLVEKGRKFPFILLCPQCPEKTIWDNKLLVTLLDEIQSKYNVDKSRVYLTGLSMGGHATWSLAIQYPERFAAIIPVCARGYSQDVYVLKDVPVWVFHGAKDDIVPISDGKKMADALEKAGGKIKFTIYPEANHDAWTETYNNPEVYEWLLSQSLEDRK